LLLSSSLLALDYFECIDVIDGETIVIEINNKPVQVKLIGIDTPEAIYPIEPFEYIGAKSLSFVKKMVLGKRVRLEYDSIKSDDSGRLLAYVYLGNSKTSINEEIIKRGFGFVRTIYPFKYLQKFSKFQKEAKENGIGLWRWDGNNTYYRLTLDVWHLWLYVINVFILIIGLASVGFAFRTMHMNQQAQLHSAFLESEKEFYELNKIMLKDADLRQYYKMGDPYLQSKTDNILKQYIFYELYYGHFCRTFVTLHSRYFKFNKKFREKYWQLYQNMLNYLLDDEVFLEVHKWAKETQTFEQEFVNEVDSALQKKNRMINN
jgi:micrococcal nuclease